MIRAIVIAVALAACGDNTVAPDAAPAPDAAVDAPLPACADVGCPNNALCRSDGRCSCPQPDGTFVACMIGGGS